MVYVKKNTEDGTITKVTNPRKRRGKPALTKKQAAAVRAIAKKQDEIAKERKQFDDAANTNTLVNAGVFVQLTPVPQGSSAVTRVGEEIDPNGLFIRGELAAGSGGAASQQTRLMVIQWYPNGADHVISLPDLMTHATTPYSFRNRDFTRQYKVLWDFKGSLVSSTGNPDFSKYFDINIPGKQMRNISYNGSGTDGENQIWLVGYSSEVTTAPVFKWTSRFVYTDS